MVERTNLNDIWRPIAETMRDERTKAPTFQEKHPFRVPLPDGAHVRFTCLENAADSAVYHTSYVVDERPGRNAVYDHAACVEIHNARRYSARQEMAL